MMTSVRISADTTTATSKKSNNNKDGKSRPGSSWLGSTTLPMPCKRRRISGAARALPKQGALARHLAALCIQKGWHRCKTVKNDVDPYTQEPVPHGPRRFLLVDSDSVSYKFDGPTFAAAVLCSGSFEHPILRRSLLGPEVIRLGRAAGLSAFGRAVLRVAFDHREKVLKHVAAQNSLVSFLEDEAGAALNTVLDRAGFFSEALLDDYEGIGDYSLALDVVATTRPRALESLISVHRNIVLSRTKQDDVWMKDTREDLLDVMSDAQQEAGVNLRRDARRGHIIPLTSLGDWLQHQQTQQHDQRRHRNQYHI